MFGRIVLIVFLFAAATAAQDSRPASPLGALASDDPRTAAWGAYEAGVFNIAAASEPLLAYLERIADPSVPNRRPQVNACLEALRSLWIVVPTALLRKVYDIEPVLVLAIECRDSERHLEHLIEIAGADRRDALRQAAVNALVKRHPEEAVLVSLRGLELRLALVVYDGEDDGISYDEMNGVSGGRSPRLTGYPPYVDYIATFRELPQALVLSPGPVSVYATRTLSSTGPSSGSRVLPDVADEADHRLQTLAYFAKAPFADIGIAGRREARLLVKSPDDYRAQAIAAKERYAADLVKLLDRVGAKVPLDPAARAAALAESKITLAVHDNRKDTSSALPKL